MTRAANASVYDDDFFAWTQEQAAALRRLPHEIVGEHVDIEHVAEEIEDLGKRDLREVNSYLERLFEHLLKIVSMPGAPEVNHWQAEARAFQRGALAAFTPSMRGRLDISATWAKACRHVAVDLADLGIAVEAATEPPSSLNELVDDDFDLDTALAKLASATPMAPGK